MAWLVIFSASAASQTSPPSITQLSPVERNQPDFYAAIAEPGKAVKVEWRLEKPALVRGELAPLSLVVRNAANPTELIAPPLRKLPGLDTLFTNISDGDVFVQPDGSAVEIRYRVVARTVGEFEVPELVYRVYHPNLPANRRLQTIYAPAISFTVTEPPLPARSVEPLTAPAEFWELPDLSESGWNDQDDGPSEAAFMLTLIGAAVVLVVWVKKWKELFPDEARLASIRRNRAVRIALDHLRMAHQHADSASRVEEAFLGYMQARLGLTPSARTPTDVRDGLAGLGLQQEHCDTAASIIMACHESRFGPACTSSHAELSRTAAKFIETCEAKILTPSGGRKPPVELSQADQQSHGGLAAPVELSQQDQQSHGGLAPPARKTVISLVVLFVFAASAVAGYRMNVRDQAIDAFRSGVALQADASQARPEFARAADFFDEYWMSGNHASYLASARVRSHFLSGDVARALSAAHEGLHEHPADAILQRLLELCRDQVVVPAGMTIRPPRPSELRHRITSWDLFVFHMISAIVSCVGFARWLTIRSRRMLILGLVALFGMLVIVPLGMKRLEYELNRNLERSIAIVQSPMPLRSGNGESYPTRFESRLPAGAEVEILGQRGDWSQIRLADGTVGWVPKVSLLTPTLDRRS